MAARIGSIGQLGGAGKIGLEVVSPPIEPENGMPALLADRMDNTLGLNPIAVGNTGKQLVQIHPCRLRQRLPADDPRACHRDYWREVTRAAGSLDLHQLAGFKAGLSSSGEEEYEDARGLVLQECDGV